MSIHSVTPAQLREFTSVEIAPAGGYIICHKDGKMMRGVCFKVENVDKLAYWCREHKIQVIDKRKHAPTVRRIVPPEPEGDGQQSDAPNAYSCDDSAFEALDDERPEVIEAKLRNSDTRPFMSMKDVTPAIKPLPYSSETITERGVRMLKEAAKHKIPVKTMMSVVCGTKRESTVYMYGTFEQVGLAIRLIHKEKAMYNASTLVCTNIKANDGKDYQYAEVQHSNSLD